MVQQPPITKDTMFYRFSGYGFLKNLRFFEPFLLLILRSYGLSFFQIGILYSIRDITANILEIPTGVIADSFGRRRSMISAFVSYILSFLMFYFLSDFWLLALAMIIFALGEAFRSGTHKALILAYLENQGTLDLKVGYYGMTRAAAQVGSAVNALAAAGLVFFSGSYRLMFLAAVIPYAANLVNLVTYPAWLDRKSDRLKGSGMWPRIKATGRDFISALRDRTTIRILLTGSAFTGVFKTVKDYLQPLLAGLAVSAVGLGILDSTGREAVLIGVVYFGIYLLASLASRSASAAAGRFGGPEGAVDLTFQIGIGFLVLSGAFLYLEWDLLAVVPFVGLYLINNIRRPVVIGLISNQLSSRVMASGLSTETQLTTIISAAAAPLVGLMADQIGLGLSLAAAGIIAGVGYLGIRAIPDSESDPVT